MAINKVIQGTGHNPHSDLVPMEHVVPGGEMVGMGCKIGLQVPIGNAEFPTQILGHRFVQVGKIGTIAGDGIPVGALNGPEAAFVLFARGHMVGCRGGREDDLDRV